SVWERAIQLREALTSIFCAVAENQRIRPGALDVLNGELAGAMARSQVVPTDTGFTWLWAEGGRALDCVLWPVARSAADLLTEGPLGAIRRCEGRGCGWLFLDTSRNRTRRWCDMRICGNRAKARRLGRGGVTVAAACGTAVGTLRLAAGRVPPVTLAGALVMGTSGSLLLVVVPAFLADRHGSAAGAVLAQANSVASIFGAVAPF